MQVVFSDYARSELEDAVRYYELQIAGPIMLSALQHFSYCPRQCALIHQEQTFDDNVHTVRGHLAHERVDSGESGVESWYTCKYDVSYKRVSP
jgi:hypothetical protein